MTILLRKAGQLRSPITVANMPKKSSGRKKGLQRGIPRRLVASKDLASDQEGEQNGTMGMGFLGISRSKYLAFGKKCFEIMLISCEKFHLLGFTRNKNGEYVKLSRKALIWHYVAIFVGLAVCFQRTWGTVQVFLYEELRMDSFLCLCVAFIHICTVLLGMGVVTRPKETMDLINSWSHLSESLKIFDPTSEFHPLDNSSAYFKSISGALVGEGMAAGVSLCCLILGDLPVLLFPTAEKFGLLLPGGVLPKWAWQILFAPLEWLVVQPFVLIGAMSAVFLYMENGALDIISQQLRGIQVCSMRSRRRVERMYVQLELFNQIAQVWIRYYFPPFLVALSAGVIITTFVSIRYTELPLIIYMMFPYTALTLMLLILWQSYDMYRVIRASEDILGKLWQHHAVYFRGMTRAERVGVMKRSRAMRAIVFTVADSEFSLSVPINAWDEIVNQVMFLLSL